MLVRVGNLNGLHLKQNGGKNIKKDTRNKGHSKNIEKFKRDQNCNCVTVSKPSDDPIPWNTPYR